MQTRVVFHLNNGDVIYSSWDGTGDKWNKRRYSDSSIIRI